MATQERHATKCLNILSKRCRQILKSILQIIEKAIKMKKHDNSNMQGCYRILSEPFPD